MLFGDKAGEDNCQHFSASNILASKEEGAKEDKWQSHRQERESSECVFSFLYVWIFESLNTKLSVCDWLLTVNKKRTYDDICWLFGVKLVMVGDVPLPAFEPSI